jgi:hypothetical protein
VTQIATEAGHWYTATGLPAYEIEGKNGELRPTTLRDARKLNLYPSVTTIMRCADAPALNRWKQQQILMSALTLPRLDDETTEAYAARIVKDADEQSNKARDIGSLIHGCIERCLLQGAYDDAYASHVEGSLEALGGWCGLESIRPEKSFCHPLGFGGKVDVHKKPEIDLNVNHPGFVADFKSKDFDSDNLPLTYENHAMQLAAYREGFDMPDARCAIIFVSTKVPGLTHLVEIGSDELTRGWEMFKALLSFWQLKNRYAPN